MKKGQKLLEMLVRKELISGFNRYISPFDLSGNSLLVLSNLHETKAYREAVQKDLKGRVHLDKETACTITKRKGFTRWDLGYRIRDDEGNLLPGLKIKEKNTYLNLEEVQTKTLEEAGFSEEYIRTLIGITDAYEIRVQCSHYNLVQDFQMHGQIFMEPQ